METAEISLDELVAHRPPMRFIHRVLSISDGEAVVEATVGPDNPLFIPGRGLPAYAGVEMMAQAIAAIDGMKRKLEGLPPKIGFLLGCRRYSVDRVAFEENLRLKITATMVFSDGEMFAFECRIEGAGGEAIAHANMNVYAPHDPEAYLNDGNA